MRIGLSVCPSYSLVRMGCELRIVFKAPDGDEDEHSASAPLLSMVSGGRATSSDEEREIWEAEGPNTALRGTLLDGIANVRLPSPSKTKSNADD